MDIPLERPKTRRKPLLLGGAALGLVLLLVGVSRLKPAAPLADRQALLLDAVKQGPMVFQVRGTGTLVPLNVRWLTAATPGRVEQIRILPGTAVKAGDVILELSNPEVQQGAQDSEWALKSAEADLLGAKARLETSLLDVRASLASAKASSSNARMTLDANEKLASAGLVSGQDLARSRAQSEEQSTRFEIEQRRLQISADSLKAQLATYQAKVEQARALYALRRGLLEGLKVRAGMDGVLQQLPVQVGQQLSPGTTLAKVAQPTLLKAELKISETQAKDLALNLPVSVDTRNGLVAGHVLRIDPAVQNGTVTVDVALDGALPKGARPDLSVEGVIEIDKAASALSVGRPVQAQPHSQATLFKLSPDGSEATRVKVRLGRGSVNAIEVLEGLQPGDKVILSDTSAWDGADRIRIQ
ncbi:MAG TPA: HlyD family efflux transporter periplasmic adaptor subunit [Holophagaceae bacterium]|nr:HlyD family efflux transporter periplasmic adaptor subunit [Holophagaceae bacterium]